MNFNTVAVDTITSKLHSVQSVIDAGINFGNGWLVKANLRMSADTVIVIVIAFSSFNDFRTSIVVQGFVRKPNRSYISVLPGVSYVSNFLIFIENWVTTNTLIINFGQVACMKPATTVDPDVVII